VDRAEFLGRAGCGCGLALLFGMARSRAAAAEDGTCEKAVEFSKHWVADMMDQMDSQLDPSTRERVMEACGRACFRESHQETSPPTAAVDLNAWLAGVQNEVGAENLYREGDTVHFKYVANPRGLRVADGYCLCPIVEDGPRTLSPTYCHCSVGYVSELFARGSGRPVKVELLDSLRRGGKECHFVVRFLA
jgi:hypothetical protein